MKIRNKDAWMKVCKQKKHDIEWQVLTPLSMKHEMKDAVVVVDVVKEGGRGDIQ